MDDTLAGVTVVTLRVDGTLTLDGSAVTTNQTVTNVDIEAGKLSCAPPANANGTGYASFTFRVSFSDGTGNSDSHESDIDRSEIHNHPCGGTLDTDLRERFPSTGYHPPQRRWRQPATVHRNGSGPVDRARIGEPWLPTQ